MKVIIEIKDADKLSVLDSCLMSDECKQIGNDVVLWYYQKSYWLDDLKTLKKAVKQKIDWKQYRWK